MLRRIYLCFFLLIILFMLPGCGTASEASFDAAAISSYRDIPQILDEEIEAIEALKDTREKFTFGQMEETEAFILPDGTYAGFTVEFCGLLSRLFDLDFSLGLYDWETLKNGVDNREIDFTGDLTPTPERLRQYYMTHPIAERSLRIFTLEGSDEIMSERDVNGLKIGSLAGTIDIDHVTEYYPELLFTVVEVESFDDAADMLKSGKIDAFVSEGVIDPLFAGYGGIQSKELFPLVYTSVSLTTANPDLKPVIDVFNKYLSAGGIDVLFDYYKKGNTDYARYKLTQSFTEREKAYIDQLSAKGSTVKIALEKDNYPICFYDKGGKIFQGIALDVLDEISGLTGISFEAANDEQTPWSEILRMLRSGEASMVSQLLYSDERKNSFLWTGKPYASSDYALLSKYSYPGIASYQVVRARVGAINKSAFEDKYNEWFPDNGNLILYDEQLEALDALESGEIDLLMGSDYLLLMQQNYREKPGFKINVRFGTPMLSYFGFNVKEEDLCSIVDKAQSYVDVAAISNDWTSRGYDYAKNLARQRALYFAVTAVVLSCALVLTGFFLLKNRRLNARLDQTVREITLDIQNTVAQLKAVISNYTGVIWSVDKDGVITLFNGLYLNTIGVGPDFLEGKKLEAARAKGRHLDIIDNVRKTMEEGAQDWVADIDGKMFQSRTTRIQDGNGNVTGVVGNTHDITETIELQNKLEEALKKAEAAVSELEKAQLTVSAMFGANPQMNILFDSEFKVLDCNPAAYEFMGFATKEEMIEGFIERILKSIPEYQSSGRPSISLTERLVTAVREGHSTFETELNIIDETRILSVELIRIPYGDSFALVGYIFDMTEIRERESELIRRDAQLSEAVEEARAANRAKSDFLSNMSHEIRTPLNAILGIAEIQLQNESLDQEVREALGKVYNSGDLLLGIINDILDLSKIEAGKMELTIANYEIASLISDTAQLNMMRIGSKPIAFDLTVDEETPSVLIGDELRVKQILNNLLSNAFKYTAEGTVALSVSVEAGDREASKATLVFKVRDTGQGMTGEQIAKLFDQYSRFNLTANRTTEGTGLGMSITRNLVTLMGGEIQVESEPDKGSEFTVRLPQGDAGSGPLGREMTENLHQFRQESRAQMKRVQITREPMPYGSVLIVDDVETNIYVAKGLLTPYDLRIDSAESGFDAIKKIQDGNSYDIVFMDHMMPKMDGMEATKIIRDNGYQRPIVALTANAVVGQSELFLSNGFDDFISKPIDIRQLNAVLNKFIRDRQPPEVLAEARNRAAKDEHLIGGQGAGVIDPRYAEVFVRDANKALALLEGLLSKQGALDEDDLRAYVISVHGMKGALANIGETGISAAALRLEQNGRAGNKEIVMAETPAFLHSLQETVEKIAPAEKEDSGAAGYGDEEYLREKLLEVKEACGIYDIKSARDLIADLREKTWPQPTVDFLRGAAENLLHSDFDEVVSAADQFLEAR